MRWPWSRKASRPRVPLRWIEVDAADTGQHATAISDIFARRIDGMTVTGIFTAEECQRAIDALAPTTDLQLPTMFGTVLGQPVAMRPDPEPGPEDRTAYLDATERCAPLYRDAFGFDPFDRIAAAVRPMAGGRSVGPPEEHGRPYAPGNVRWYQPGLGGLPAHVGNEFPMHWDNSLWYFRQFADPTDHISYFVVLQPPDEGGELSVFDLLWEDPKPDVEAWRDDGREDAALDHYPATKFSPEPGTMLIFGGGWRWHRVEPIGGTRPRITYGGFACRGREDDALYFWI